MSKSVTKNNSVSPFSSSFHSFRPKEFLDPWAKKMPKKEFESPGPKFLASELFQLSTDFWLFGKIFCSKQSLTEGRFQSKHCRQLLLAVKPGTCVIDKILSMQFNMPLCSIAALIGQVSGSARFKCDALLQADCSKALLCGV